MADEISKIIDSILVAEGGAKITTDPLDAGGATRFGISKNANPDAWKNGPPSEEEARAIYRRRYVEQPGFDKLIDQRLMHFMVDWGVLSGVTVAIRHLQLALGLEDDGLCGPNTLAAANAAAQPQLLNRLVVDRIKMLGRIVQKNPSQSRFISGWMERVFEFLVI